MWISRNSENFRKLVKKVIEKGGWPVYETYDDNGLDMEQYEELAEQFIDAFEQMTSDYGR